MDTTALVKSTERLPADQNPALVYLASLNTPDSRRGMASALRTVTRLLGVGDVDWRGLRFQHVAAIRSEMIGQGKKPGTVNKTLAALRGVARAAWQLGWIDAEERARIQDVRNVRGQTVPAGRGLGSGEVQALAQVCASDNTPAGARDAAIIGLLYACGLRRAEVVKLDLADLAEHDGAYRLTVRGKGNKERYAYADNGARVALEAWLQVRGQDAGPLFLPVNKGGRVIRSQRLTAQAVYYMLQKRGQQGAVQSFTPHDLRRSFIGDMLDAGIDIATVQHLAGHANVSTTARYDRRPEATKRRAVKVLHFPYAAAPA